MSVIKGTVEVFMKHDDRTSFEVVDPNFKTLFEQDSHYLPDLAVFGGDDTTLRIDNETGTIIGWKPITTEQLDELNENDT
jgi:hypothetical protein